MIGIHYGASIFEFNKGTFIKYVINKFIKQKKNIDLKNNNDIDKNKDIFLKNSINENKKNNEINIIIKIEEKDINNNLFFKLW